MLLLFVVYKVVLNSGAQVAQAWPSGQIMSVRRAGLRPATPAFLPAFFRGSPSKNAGNMPASQAESPLHADFGRRA